MYFSKFEYPFRIFLTHCAKCTELESITKTSLFEMFHLGKFETI